MKGIPYITPDLFSFTYTSDNVSLMPALISTVVMTIIALVIALPLGIGAAIYSVEYAKRGNKLVQLVRITTETLSGIPSIVYGLFGYLCFVTALHWGYSLLAGAFTVAIMILPLIMRTTEEALISVPDSFREGSFGLGAGRLRTVFHIVLPSAVPGILSGVILAIGRVVGESAALMYTAGSVGAGAGQAGGRFVRFPCEPSPCTCMCFRARACTSTKRMPQRLCCWLSSSASTHCPRSSRRKLRRNRAKASFLENHTRKR